MTTATDNPRYLHDGCDHCTWLGQMGDEDVWACMQGGELPTIIIRWGNASEDYRSASQMFEKLTPELQDKARAWLADDPDVQFILRTLKDAGGSMHFEHLEHRFEERAKDSDA